MEFAGALSKLSRTEEYKAARIALESQKDKRYLVALVSKALQYFQANHKTLKSLRNSVSGHFHDEAAAYATRHAHPDAIARLEVVFHPSGRGGGPKLHYAGELAATAFTKRLPGVKDRGEEIADVIRMIRDGYAQATRAMHALVVAFSLGALRRMSDRVWARVIKGGVSGRRTRAILGL